jgi:hypothetical protein
MQFYGDFSSLCRASSFTFLFFIQNYSICRLTRPHLIHKNSIFVSQYSTCIFMLFVIPDFEANIRGLNESLYMQHKDRANKFFFFSIHDKSV